MENVYIKNLEELERKIKKFKEGGAGKLYVLADFDRTLTKAFVNGEKIPSVISVLRDGNYLTKDYAKKAHALFDKFHPIEVDLNVSLKEKKKEMLKWWTRHFDLLIKSGLNKNDIEKVIDSGKIKFREGALKFVDMLHSKNIPLVILSSAGLGEDSISIGFEKEKKLFDNVHVVSNSFKWDEEGNAIGVEGNIIHVFNKDETALPEEIHDKVQERKNVILMGDSLGDLGMIEGFDFDKIIRIGFLNEKVEENLKKYSKEFDVVILNDGDFDFVNEMVGKILNNKS